MSDIRDKVLEFCNEVRGSLGLKPVDHLYKGVRLEPDSCVISNTIRGDDDLEFFNLETSPHIKGVKPGMVWVIMDNDPNMLPRTFDLPKEINDFACDFDDGLYPDLVTDE